MPEIRQAFETRQSEAVGSTSEELGRIVARDMGRWAKLAKEGNIKFD